MLDVDTFLTWLYVVVDDWVKQAPAPRARPGPVGALSASEVVTLALFSQWACFATERAFYRYACRHLRAAFPALPDRGQLNRLVRAHTAAITALGHRLAAAAGARTAAYQALDGTAVPVRNAKRRGTGWLGGEVDIGWSSLLGWYEGFYLLIAVTPTGAVTGYGIAPASTKDQRAAETFLALRHAPDPRLPSVGPPSPAPYVADMGFAGEPNHRHWRADYGALVISPPQHNSRQAWPAALQRWLSRRRQIVETVFAKLQHTFRLRADRPHHLTGFRARLAATIALHNFCLWLNRQLGRAPLAFADLIAW